MEDNITDGLRDFMREIYSNLRSEYDYLQSDEAVDDAIIANEWEFLESGDIY
jgi:hypothetical protein